MCALPQAQAENRTGMTANSLDWIDGSLTFLAGGPSYRDGRVANISRRVVLLNIEQKQPGGAPLLAFEKWPAEPSTPKAARAVRISDLHLQHQIYRTAWAGSRSCVHFLRHKRRVMAITDFAHNQCENLPRLG